MLCKLAFFSFLQVVETIVKVSPQRGTELFAPVLLKICHMILEVEVILLSGSHCQTLFKCNVCLLLRCLVSLFFSSSFMKDSIPLSKYTQMVLNVKYCVYSLSILIRRDYERRIKNRFIPQSLSLKTIVYNKPLNYNLVV